MSSKFLALFLGVMCLATSLTLKMDDKSLKNLPTLLIFKKSKPSILVFSPNQQIILKYPRLHRQTILNFNQDSSITVKRVNDEQAEELSKEAEQYSQKHKKKQQNSKQSKHQQSKNQKVNQKQSVEGNNINKKTDEAQKKKSEATARKQKKPLPLVKALIGKYIIQNMHSHYSNNKQLSFNNTHVSYTICSQNQCQYRAKKNKIEFGDCTLRSRSSCEAFSDQFYQDFLFLTNLQLSTNFQREGQIVKFYDSYDKLRLKIERTE